MLTVIRAIVLHILNADESSVSRARKSELGMNPPSQQASVNRVHDQPIQQRVCPSSL